MASFLADLRDHRRTAATFLLIWVVVSILTIATWQYRDGHAFGMHPVMIPFQFAMPLLAGALVGNWPRNGLVEGALTGFLEIAIQLPFGAVLLLLGKAAPDAASTSAVEAIAFLGIGTLIGGALGMIGAFAAKLYARLGGSGRTSRGGA